MQGRLDVIARNEMCCDSSDRDGPRLGALSSPPPFPIQIALLQDWPILDQRQTNIAHLVLDIQESSRASFSIALAVSCWRCYGTAFNLIKAITNVISAWPALALAKAPARLRVAGKKDPARSPLLARFKLLP